MTDSASPPTQLVRLHVLGTPSITVGDEAGGTSLGPGKSLALLAYLAVRRQVRRDELISLLWGDMPEEAARNAFRQALHRIRKAVGPGVLTADRDTIAVGGPDVLAIDRDRFLWASDAERWSEAAAVYTGDFLQDFELDEPAFDRWAGVERMQLRSRYQHALRQSGEAALRSGDTSAAIQYATRLAASAPYETEPALFQANVLVSAGKASEALSGLRQFVSRLQTELELPAPPAAAALIARLDRGDARQSGLPGAAPGERRAPSIIGRDGEIARLLGGVAAARAEKGSAFVLEGEPGMGRTRLLEELRRRVRDLGGVIVLHGRERASTSVVPYAGIAEALRPLARAAGISGASPHLLAEAARLLPELRDAFDLPELEAVEDAAGRLRFFEGIAATIDAAAYEQPLCILIDDAHHASPPSLDLLAYLVGRLRASPVMFVLSVRAERSQAVERIRGMAQTGGDEDAGGVMVLPPLSPEEVRALAAQVAGPDARSIDPERIARQSRGRPALVIDLARRAAAGETPSEAPALLRDVLWARLQAAPPSQRRVFFAASLLDRVAPVRLLAAAAHLPEAATLDAAIELARAGLLEDRGDGYAVAHDSTHGFVEETSGIAGRALLAGWAADALAGESTNVDAELAHLYAMAGRASLAFTHARAAAFAAAAMGASAEAIHHLGVALSFAPDDRARSQIESLLAAYGHGTLRLGAGESQPAPAPAIETESPDAPSAPDGSSARRPTPQPPEVAQPATTLWRRSSMLQWAVSISISAIVILLGVLARRQLMQSRPAVAPIDSLIVTRRDGATGESVPLAVAVSTAGAQGPLAPHPRDDRVIGWLASVAPPWTDPLPSPDGRRVAITLVTSHGKDLYVVSADRRDTTVVASGNGDNVALAWAPDGRGLLVSRSRTLGDGSYDSDLYAYRVDPLAAPIAIDTSSTRSITEARWSPTGLQVAWVARVGASRQRDVFVARADGGDLRNITNSTADDFGIAWSPDGSLLAMTSTRSGAPRVYTYDFENAKLWSVSDRDGEDHATFSPDSRLIAFEATRDGDVGVYLRPALGGAARRLTPPDGQYAIVGWSQPATGWIERVRIIGTPALAVGDSTTLSVLSVASSGAPVSGVTPEWSIDGDAGVLESRPSRVGARLSVVARHEGMVRVVATVPGWRSDTLSLIVAPADVALSEDFSRGMAVSRWVPVGEPVPFVGPSPVEKGSRALFPNGDMEWDSGILSRSVFQLAPGGSLSARIVAPFAGHASPAAINIGFVPVGSVSRGNALEPRPVIGISWDGQSGAFRYVIGRESFSDAEATRTDSAQHEIGIRIAADSTVIFSVDGKDRWRSSLRYVADAGPRVQLWAGGHATGNTIAITRLSVSAGTAR